MKNKPKVVIMGGGTGIFPVTAALKHLDVGLSTIIAVSDSGGSTGRIRDEFGFQPVGDLRQSLASLAEDESQDWIRKLLLYRFNKGSGLKGHNLGNLILTALQDMTGGTDEAIRRAVQVFRLEGNVIPATKDNVDIKIEYDDRSTLVGEDNLNPESKIDKDVKNISLTPQAKLNPHAEKALKRADLVIIGPGDLYGSLLAALLPSGIKQAFAKSSAKVLFIVNLMTRHHQTADMSASDHVKAIEQAIGKKVNQVLINNNNIPAEIKEKYSQENEYPVKDDLINDPRSIRAAIISTSKRKENTGDALHRSFLRHDSAKLIPVLKKILNHNGHSQV